MIHDPNLRHVILGTIHGVVTDDHFPLPVYGTFPDFDDKGVIQSFVIIHQSGAMFRVHVDYLGVQGEEQRQY